MGFFTKIIKFLNILSIDPLEYWYIGFLFFILNSSHLISQSSLDQLEYIYNTNTNQLNYIADVVIPSTSLTDLDNQSSNNYKYDASGRLVCDVSEGILNIEWAIGDKIKQLTFDDSNPLDGIADRTLQFKYDALGNRVKKIETNLSTSSPKLTTYYYVRNAMGELISIYKDDGSGIKRDEIEITDGSDNIPSASLVSTTEFERKVGFKNYELKDHLGNVRVVVSDEKEVIPLKTIFKGSVQSASDYYSYGMVMPCRDYKSDDYKWGYQRKEKDDELKGNGNSYDFGARILDPRVGLWLSPDPLASGFPDQSPYVSMGNNPVNRIDPDGKAPIDVNDYDFTYESGITEKWVDYLRIYHPDEYSEEEFIQLYEIYIEPGSADVEDQIYIEYWEQINKDIASGDFQPTRRMQMKDFRQKRKALIPMETILAAEIRKRQEEIMMRPEPDPTPVIPTTVETPEYLIELFKPIDDLLADPYGFKQEKFDALLSKLSVPLTPKQKLNQRIDALSKQIESDKAGIEMLQSMNMPDIQPNIDSLYERIAASEKEREEKRKELEKFNELEFH